MLKGGRADLQEGPGAADKDAAPSWPLDVGQGDYATGAKADGRREG